jgi:hypothetical protein
MGMGRILQYLHDLLRKCKFIKFLKIIKKSYNYKSLRYKIEGSKKKKRERGGLRGGRAPL